MPENCGVNPFYYTYTWLHWNEHKLSMRELNEFHIKRVTENKVLIWIDGFLAGKWGIIWSSGFNFQITVIDPVYYFFFTMKELDN